MPMNPATLKAAIKSGLIATYTAAESATMSKEDFADRVAATIADEVVSHIAANATVSVTSVSGVQTGPGVSGPGTGSVS